MARRERQQIESIEYRGDVVRDYKHMKSFQQVE